MIMYYCNYIKQYISFRSYLEYPSSSVFKIYYSRQKRPVVQESFL
jgi:hypothetical protein